MEYLSSIILLKLKEIVKNMTFTEIMGIFQLISTKLPDQLNDKTLKKTHFALFGRYDFCIILYNMKSIDDNFKIQNYLCTNSSIIEFEIIPCLNEYSNKVEINTTFSSLTFINKPTINLKEIKIPVYVKNTFETFLSNFSYCVHCGSDNFDDLHSSIKHLRDIENCPSSGTITHIGFTIDEQINTVREKTVKVEYSFLIKLNLPNSNDKTFRKKISEHFISSFSFDLMNYYGYWDYLIRINSADHPLKIYENLSLILNSGLIKESLTLVLRYDNIRKEN